MATSGAFRLVCCAVACRLGALLSTHGTDCERCCSWLDAWNTANADHCHVLGCVGCRLGGAKQRLWRTRESTSSSWLLPPLTAGRALPSSIELRLCELALRRLLAARDELVRQKHKEPALTLSAPLPDPARALKLNFSYLRIL